jgi:hypothetical protein
VGLMFGFTFATIDKFPITNCTYIVTYAKARLKCNIDIQHITVLALNWSWNYALHRITFVLHFKIIASDTLDTV